MQCDPLAITMFALGVRGHKAIESLLLDLVC